MIPEILRLGSDISPLPAFLILVFNYRKFVLPIVKFIGYFVIYRMLAETAFILSNKLIGANTPLIALNSIVECALVCLICTAPPKYQKLRKWYMGVSLLLGVIMVWAVVFKPHEYPSEARILQFTFLISIITVHIYKAIQFAPTKPYELFILIALWGYFVMSSVTFYSANKISAEWANSMYVVHDIMNIGTNLFIAFTLLNFLKVFYGASKQH